MPMLSFRADPLNWLLNGRLGIEMEAQIYKFITFEVVPEFVAWETPLALRNSFETTISQHSEGIGPISGAAFSAGFWLSGKAMRGTVLRAIITNHSYRYAASDQMGVFDEVSHVDRHLYFFVGSQSRSGLFTMGGGFGLGLELNKEQRCFTKTGAVIGVVTSGCPKEEMLIALDRTYGAVGNLHGFLYPIQLMFRFSLGVTF
ncbi:MAG: hypothetical protein QM756_22080 [Polyangiaceae bacterium]